MSKAVEKYYSIAEVALLLGVSTKTVFRRIKEGELDQVVNIGGSDRPSYRVPASAINAYLEKHKVGGEPGIAARSVGELKRKAAA